jgi:endonuclease-3
MFSRDLFAAKIVFLDTIGTMTADLTSLRSKYNTIYQAFAQTYGEPTWQPHNPPVDELVCTILSQATSDTNRDKGFNALKARYSDWESVMNAPTEEVVATIYSAGLANQKGPRIQAALHYVAEKRGTIDLDFLAEMPLTEAVQWLTNIKGVGRKTAAIILLFSFGRPTFPVDTHVHRITQRVGLIGQRVTATKAHDLLEQIGDPDTFYPMHLNLIQHGRKTCIARNPHCHQCPIQIYCDYYKRKVISNQ